MYRFCLLSMLVCLPLGSYGGNLRCRDEIDTNPNIARPRTDLTNYVAYAYEGDVENDCINLQVTCVGRIDPNHVLSGRSFYITNIRPDHGLFYDERVIQDFIVQCPMGNYLHLHIQNSDLPSGDGLANGCQDNDYVRVTANGIDDTIFCGDNMEARRRAADLYNFGRGRIFADGRASISFYSDGTPSPENVFFEGFVVRATCLRPLDFLSTACPSYTFFAAWDPDFTGIINNLPEVERGMFNHPPTSSTVGKRQVEGVEQRETIENVEAEAEGVVRRSKRSQLESYELMAGDRVTYVDNTTRIEFSENNTLNGQPRPDVVIEDIFKVEAFTQILSTRSFRFSAPYRFFGPGKVDVTGRGDCVVLTYTIPDDQVERTFLASIGTAQAANLIHEYIFNNFVRPYPVIDSVDRRGDGTFPPLPLQPGDNPPDQLKSFASLNFVREFIDRAEGRCYRAIRIFDAPARDTRLPKELTSFCKFFHNACYLQLLHACNDANLLDPQSVGK